MPNENSSSEEPSELNKPPETLEAASEETAPAIDTPQETTPVETAEDAKPIIAPTQPQPEQHAIQPAHNTAGALVLQWLTYAFWGWLILALIWLAGVVFASAIMGEPAGGMLPYAMAACIVLVPLAFVTDIFYRKHEPLKKVGGASIIMVIHAVIFALLGIASLIVVVFTGINLGVEVNTSDAPLIVIYTALTATALYALAFLRTLNPFKSKKPLLIYSLVMLAVTATLIISAIIGPMAQSFATRNDRLIEENLSAVQDDISQYINTNNKVPASLNDVTLSSDAQVLVDKGLVEYKPEDSVKKLSSTEYRYQLCVEFVGKTADQTYYGSKYQPQNEYDNYVSASAHDSGEECYKLQTTVYTYNTNAEDTPLKTE